MENKSVNEFADLYEAVGDLVRMPFYLRLGYTLENSAHQTLMERRGRWFSFTEDIYWRGFAGEICHGSSLVIKSSNGEWLGSATLSGLPAQVVVGGRDFTFELVQPKWWSANLVLRDDQGDVIDGKYNSQEFRLLRPIESLPVAVAIYWRLFQFERNS